MYVFVSSCCCGVLYFIKCIVQGERPVRYLGTPWSADTSLGFLLTLFFGSADATTEEKRFQYMCETLGTPRNASEGFLHGILFSSEAVPVPRFQTFENKKEKEKEKEKETVFPRLIETLEDKGCERAFCWLFLLLHLGHYQFPKPTAERLLKTHVPRLCELVCLAHNDSVHVSALDASWALLELLMDHAPFPSDNFPWAELRSLIAACVFPSFSLFVCFSHVRDT